MPHESSLKPAAVTMTFPLSTLTRHRCFAFAFSFLLCFHFDIWIQGQRRRSIGVVWQSNHMCSVEQSWAFSNSIAGSSLQSILLAERYSWNSLIVDVDDAGWSTIATVSSASLFGAHHRSLLHAPAAATVHFSQRDIEDVFFMLAHPPKCGDE